MHDSESFTTKHDLVVQDFDPDSTNATDAGWLDMQNFNRADFYFIRTIGTSDISGVRILSNPNSDGSGTDFVAKDIGTIADADAAFDKAHIGSITADQLNGNQYASAQFAFATATDEGIVLAILSEPRFAHEGLDSDDIA